MRRRRLAQALQLYSGQALVHTSGLLGAEVLEPAMAAGTQAGGFHPLVAFADVDRALDGVAGRDHRGRGRRPARRVLAELAESIGGDAGSPRPGLARPPITRPRCWPPAAWSPCSMPSREVAAVAGLDEAGAMAVYLPLARQALANARALGIAASLTGPFLRGDAGTVAAHLAVLAAARAGRDGALPRRSSNGSIDGRRASWRS